MLAQNAVTRLIATWQPLKSSVIVVSQRSRRSVSEKACGDGLTGTGNSLVKSEVAVERRLYESAS